jgi:hypothetical protein
MSFVVEIPSAFTKSVQIPNRLGNTTLTGNETIHGSVIVNGSLTLDGVGSNSGEPVYDSIKVTNDIEVGGNILSSRFRVDKIIDNLSGQFLDSSSPSNVTLAELIVYGGTLHMSFECGGSRTAIGLANYTFVLTQNSQTIKSTVASYYFNQANVSQYWARNDVYTNVPAGTYILSVSRNDTNLRHGVSDFFNVVLIENPF